MGNDIYLFPLGLPLSSLRQLSPNERVCSVNFSMSPSSLAQKSNKSSLTPVPSIIYITLLYFPSYKFCFILWVKPSHKGIEMWWEEVKV